MQHIARTRSIAPTKSLKDPASCISHVIGTIMAILSLYPLVHRAYLAKGALAARSMLIFSITLILLYLASSMYHGVISTQTVERRLKKFDHMMVYCLIAGTYTPICTLALSGSYGQRMLLLIWAIAFVGMIINAIWIYCPKWLNSLVYIAMGWVVILAAKQVIYSLSMSGFLWLLAGGIIYTIGGVIYALKLPLFNDRHPGFGTHEIFHIFCIAGSMCHYILMYFYVL